MRKLKFASLHRTEHGIVYLMHDGRDVQHNKLSLGAYRDKAKDESFVWTVVELTSGLSVATGPTYNKAVDAAYRKIEEAGLDKIRYAIEKSIKEHGPTPGHRITYL